LSVRARTPSARTRRAQWAALEAWRRMLEMFFWLQHGDIHHELSEGQCVIGRSREADVVLRDKLVSPRHARILRQGTDLTIEALSSSNGVFVSGAQIPGPTPLLPGDTLFLGRNRLGLGPGAHPPQVAGGSP